MITNTVPIQLGWGAYSNGAVGTFENLTITGSAGRGSDGNAIIAASYSGTYNVTVNIDGCNIQNSNASWLSMQGSTKVKGTVKNANISLKQFWNTTRKSGTNEMIKFSCGATADTQAPTAPSSLTTSSVTQSSLTLSWTASTDNVGVTGYDVYDGTTLVASPSTSSVSITGLACNTSHSYTVKAKDAAGNKSTASTAKSVTTSACTTNTTTHFEAESYSSMSGITKETTTDTGGGSNIASIHNNDYADYSFKVAKTGTYTTKFRVSSAANGGTIQVLKGTTVLGSVKVAATGGWQTWTTITGPSIDLTSTGTQTIRLKFVNTATTDYLFNINWFDIIGSSAVKVSRMVLEEVEVPSLNISLSPNPVKDYVNLSLDTEDATILLYSSDNKLLKKIISTSKVNQINVSDLTTGVYLVKVMSADKTKTLKFIKK
jgi:chitodextrinase